MIILAPWVFPRLDKQGKCAMCVYTLMTGDSMPPEPSAYATQPDSICAWASLSSSMSSLLLLFGASADTPSSYRNDPGRGPSWTIGIAI